MKQTLASLMVALVMLQANPCRAAPVVVCDTGIASLIHYRATLNPTTQQLKLKDLKNGTVIGGIATYTLDGERKSYYLPYAFDSGIEMFYDGDISWWLCMDETDCLRCGQMIKPQPQ